MRLSSKTMYALRALFDITFHSHGKATKIDAIAARENVPPRFLEQIFQDLKAAQIVGSKRGPNGGYFLLRSPETITIGQVVRAMEGGVEHHCCFGSDAEVREKCKVSAKCVTASVWRDISVQLNAIMDAVTLSELALRGEALRLTRDSDAGLTYTI